MNEIKRITFVKVLTKKTIQRFSFTYPVLFLQTKETEQVKNQRKKRNVKLWVLVRKKPIGTQKIAGQFLSVDMLATECTKFYQFMSNTQ